MELLMFLAILVPVAAFVFVLSRPTVDDEQPPILDVQNHIADEPMMDPAEFGKRWGRIIGG